LTGRFFSGRQAEDFCAATGNLLEFPVRAASFEPLFSHFPRVVGSTDERFFPFAGPVSNPVFANRASFRQKVLAELSAQGSVVLFSPILSL
jgi:hypothetical protein